MTAVKKFNISHISQHLKLLTNFCPNIVIIGMQMCIRDSLYPAPDRVIPQEWVGG